MSKSDVVHSCAGIQYGNNIAFIQWLKKQEVNTDYFTLAYRYTVAS